jgi:sensor histidine kinase regulating citrate/malate metabolism
MKSQLAIKCKSLAATVAAVIEEDSDGYAEFLKTLDIETDYYRRKKEVMMKLKQVNEEHIMYIYTVAQVDENTIVYILGGEHPSNPMYTAPGVESPITDAERIAFSRQIPVAGDDFVETEYGCRLSAYVPIFHKDTHEFLGLVGVDIAQPQYNEIINIFIVQTVISFSIGLVIFALLMWWLFVTVKRTIESEAQVLSLQNRLAQESYEQIKAHLKEVGEIKHEIKNHVAVVRTYMKDKRYNEAETYIEQFADETKGVIDAVYHDSFVINAVVGNLIDSAQDNNIKVDLSLKVNSVQISDYDFYSLLSNILENALEACLVMTRDCKHCKKELFINLSISRREPYLNIRCENSKSSEIILVDGKIQTSKTESGHGFGLQIIGRIVDSYDGIMNVDYDEDRFVLTVALKDRI